jgi:hypothetical protein
MAGETNGYHLQDLLALPTDPPQEKSLPPNGLRYPRVGGTRQRHFNGMNSKPRKQLENAASPTRRVHAVLGAGFLIGTISSDIVSRSSCGAG